MLIENPRAQVLVDHLQAAHAELARRMQVEADAGVPHFDSVAAVSDSSITPFLNAMTAGGWIPTAKNGLLVSALTCEHCRRGASRFALEKDGVEVRCCVYCNN
jgi:hypothetical protein